MINAFAQRQPKPILDKPTNSPGRMTMMRSSVPSQDQIRDRAYQLYESCGRQTGHEKQDWLRAEQEIRLRAQ
jgi:hypothetical protein